jgi:mono/diheme cytochrome c family protein
MTRPFFALAAAALAALFLAGCSKQPEPVANKTETKADPQRELIARGEYLAAAGDCVACHTVRGGQAFAGGLEIPTPFGVLYTPNVTPDKETGIGAWTADDFYRAMHEGRSKDGSFLYPAFPYTNYTKITRADCDAIYAFFMSLAPVQQKNKPHALGFPYNQRQLLGPWRTLYFKPGEFQEDPKQSKEWNRGAYLVEGLGHCNACHSARNALGAITDEDDYSGGLIPVQNWYAPSLTSSRETGLGDWDTKEIVELLRTGVSPRSAVFGPMSAVVKESLQEMSLVDLNAMAVYLKAQSERKESAPLIPGGPSDEQVSALLRRGAKVYKDQCESCHQPNGEGVPRVYPPLANNAAITMRNAVNPIRVVLNGGFPPSTEGNPRPYGMPPFHQELGNDDVAAVVTYIRRSWGNNAEPTTAAEVGRSRGVPGD